MKCTLFNVLRFLSLLSWRSLSGASTTKNVPVEACRKELNDVHQNMSIQNGILRKNIMNAAVCFHVKNMIPEAIGLYNELRRRYPSYSFPLVNIATIHVKNGKPADALRVLTIYFHEVGGIYGDAGHVTDYDAQMLGPPCVEKAMYKDECVTALNILGISHFHLYDYNSAMTCYQRAIFLGDDVSTTMQDLYVNLGELYNVLGDYDNAARALLRSFRASLKASYGRSTASPYLDPGALIRRTLLVPSISPSLKDSIYMQQVFNKRLMEFMTLIDSGGIEMEHLSDLFLSRTSESRPITMEEIESIPPLAHSFSDFANRVQSVHFHLHYYGFNDRHSHELVASMHMKTATRSSLSTVSHHVSTYSPPRMVDQQPFKLHPMIFSSKETFSAASSARERVRVIFVSCLFGGDEPHGQLVMDVIKRLPSRIFDIHAIGMGTKPPNDDFVGVVNGNYHGVGTNEGTARSILTALTPDCVVFVENMNDAVVHFLSYTRFAPIQILLMGAPVTSGVPSIDYFLSGDRLEHPFRTHISGDLNNAEPYSEQVVVLDGQAISFGNPSNQMYPRQDSSLAAGDAKGTKSLWVNEDLQFDRFGVPIIHGAVYMCFQNLFKIHPLFDSVLTKVLHADRKGHVVLQAQRDHRKTNTVAKRIRSFVTESMCLNITKGSSHDDVPENHEPRPCEAARHILQRIHFIPRVMSNEVQSLYQSATVVLHPFPFGGSKTASDTLGANIPLVTLPQKYLRGRLAATFYATMALHEVDPTISSSVCCVANDVADYVSKSVRLGTDDEYRQRIISAIQERKHRIYDDHETSFEWARFLTRAMGVRVTTQDLALEMKFIRRSWQTEEFHRDVLRTQQKRWKRTKQEQFALSQ